VRSEADFRDRLREEETTVELVRCLDCRMVETRPVHDGEATGPCAGVVDGIDCNSVDVERVL
jgi:hypothetical protein